MRPFVKRLSSRRPGGGAWLAAGLLLTVTTLAVHAEGAVEWKTASPGYSWSFPEDHYSHPGFRTEWWYLTGHLQSDARPSRSFGFQFTIFRIGLAPERPAIDSAWASANLVMGHASIGDKQAGSHRFSEVLYRESPLLSGFGDPPGLTIAWCRGPAGTPEDWRIDWNGQGFDIEMADRSRGFAYRLNTKPSRPLIFQGPGGHSLKAMNGEAASLYYSFTRLEVEGTVELDGETIEVHGVAWADREIGSGQLTEDQVGWDWLGIQLDDGRDVMLYVLRDENGAADFGRGTVVSTDGSVRFLEPDDWRIRATGRWVSPEEGTSYPSGWRVEIPSEELDVRVVPVFEDQENRSLRTGISYWEGAVRVETDKGRPAGRGYVELTGYGEGHRPAW